MDAPWESRVIESANYCRCCRYNLTGLVEPRCPECGMHFEDAQVVNTNGITLVHVLIFINAAACVLAGFLVFSNPTAHLGNPEAGGTVVWAMLAPLQWVLGLAGGIVGLHALSQSSHRLRTWAVVMGMVTPLLVASTSLLVAL